jgi:hypothetical protein
MFDAAFKVVHAPKVRSQNMSMQSMGSVEMDPPISLNTPLS